MTPTPTRLIVLSSAQLMPSIESIMLLLTDPEVHLIGVHIYTTESEKMSRQPAVALKEFIEGLDPSLANGEKLAVHLDAVGGGITPQAVKSWVMKQMDVFSYSAWVVNMTGGVKLMQLGMPDLLLANEKLRVFYSEIAQGWFEISFKDQEVVGIGQPKWGPLATAGVDRLEIGKLALAQLGGTNAGVSVKAASIAPLVPLAEFLEFTKAIAAEAWNYHQVLSCRGLRRPTDPSGLAFEHFIGTVLLHLGVRQVVVGIKASKSGRPFMERDVVGLHNGKLWFIDCKLTKVTDPRAGQPTHQLRETLEAVQELAGLNGSIIILRPNWTQSQVELVREATALGRQGVVEVWGQAECKQLISNLHRWLKLATPFSAELRSIDDFLEQNHAAQGYTLCDPTLMPRDALSALNDLSGS